MVSTSATLIPPCWRRSGSAASMGPIPGTSSTEGWSRTEVSTRLSHRDSSREALCPCMARGDGIPPAPFRQPRRAAPVACAERMQPIVFVRRDA